MRQAIPCRRACCAVPLLFRRRPGRAPTSWLPARTARCALRTRRGCVSTCGLGRGLSGSDHRAWPIFLGIASLAPNQRAQASSFHEAFGPVREAVASPLSLMVVAETLLVKGHRSERAACEVRPGSAASAALAVLASFSCCQLMPAVGVLAIPHSPCVSCK